MSKSRETEELKVFTTLESKEHFGGTSKQSHKINEEKTKAKASSSMPSTSVEEKTSSASTSIEESSSHKSQSNYEGEETLLNKSDDDDHTSITTFSGNASPSWSENTNYSEERSSYDIMRIENILNSNNSFRQPLQTSTEIMRIGNILNSNNSLRQSLQTSTEIMRIENILNITLPPLRHPLQSNTRNLPFIEPYCEAKGPELPDFPY